MIRPISRAVAGETALASAYTPLKPATWRARSSAACGGQTATMTSAFRVRPASPPDTMLSPAAVARAALAALRPSGTHSTRCPAATRHCPTAAPISPGCSSPIVASPIDPLSPGVVEERARQRGELVPADHAYAPAAAVRAPPDQYAARRVGPQHPGRQRAHAAERPVPEHPRHLPAGRGPLEVLGLRAALQAARAGGLDHLVHRLDRAAHDGGAV